MGRYLDCSLTWPACCTLLEVLTQPSRRLSRLRPSTRWCRKVAGCWTIALCRYENNLLYPLKSHPNLPSGLTPLRGLQFQNLHTQRPTPLHFRILKRLGRGEVADLLWMGKSPCFPAEHIIHIPLYLTMLNSVKYFINPFQSVMRSFFVAWENDNGLAQLVLKTANLQNIPARVYHVELPADVFHSEGEDKRDEDYRRPGGKWECSHSNGTTAIIQNLRRVSCCQRCPNDTVDSAKQKYNRNRPDHSPGFRRVPVHWSC